MPDEDFRRIQSLDRALRMLAEIAASSQGLTATEVAERVGINRSTAWRLLGTLEQHGMLARDEMNRYELGVGVLRLASQTRWSSIVRAARPILERLAMDTGDSAAVSVVTRGGFEVLDQVDGPHALGVRWVGFTGPLFHTSPGKLVLAALDERQLSSILRDPIKATTPRSLTDPAGIRRELEEVRHRGIAFSMEDYEIGVNGISAPVNDADGELIAIVTVTGPSSRLSVERLEQIEPSVKDAAARLARALGLATPRTEPAAQPRDVPA